MIFRFGTYEVRSKARFILFLTEATEILMSMQSCEPPQPSKPLFGNAADAISTRKWDGQARSRVPAGTVD
jgi:hypothetical protein